MKRYQTGIWALLLMLGLTFVTSHVVQAATPGVVDNAHILQADTVSKVSAALGELKQKYKKDVLIETFASIPADKKDSYNPDTKAAFFSEWTKARETAEQVNGVYVLICMDPPHLQLGVGEKTQQHAFTLADRDQLKQKLIEGFKQKKYDETLREVPVFMQNTFAANLKTMKSQPVERSGAAVPVSNSSNNSAAGPVAEPTGPSFGGILFILVCILGGVMLFSFIARMLFGGGGAGAGQPGYAGGGGGGFFSSLLGGIGGAIAGNYIYDSFFRGDSHSSSSDAHASGSDSSNSSPWGDNSTDSSYSNDGGGFDSGGSDFGGGDSGGGGDF